MKLESALISIIALFLSIFLLCIGICCLAPFLHEGITNYLGAHLTPIGVMCIFCAFVLTLCFMQLCRRRYLLVKMGGMEIQDKVLAQVAHKSIASFFPGMEVSCSARIYRKKKVEIVANLPYVTFEEQEQMLTNIEQKLANTFAHQCGLTREFLFNVSFRAKMPSS